MDTRTGAIARFEMDEDAVGAGFREKLTEAQAAMLQPMNRAQRREWARKNASSEVERLRAELAEARETIRQLRAGG